jgi:hypothetical protein
MPNETAGTAVSPYKIILILSRLIAVNMRGARPRSRNAVGTGAWNSKIDRGTTRGMKRKTAACAWRASPAALAQAAELTMELNIAVGGAHNFALGDRDRFCLARVL